MTDPFNGHSFAYRYGGQEWIVTFHAEGEDDARARLRAIRGNADYLGRLQSTPIPASTPSWMMDALCAVLNAWQRFKQWLRS